MSLLWTRPHAGAKDLAAAYLAGWTLGTILGEEGVEETLRQLPLDEYRQSPDWGNSLLWIWKPFEEPPGSSLPTIAGRIAFLVISTDGLPNPRDLDLRLSLPLCATWQPFAARFLRIMTDLGLTKIEIPEGIIFDIQAMTLRLKTLSPLERVRVLQSFETDVNAPAWWKKSFRSFSSVRVLQSSETDVHAPAWWKKSFRSSSSLQWDLLVALAQFPHPEERDWQSVHRPVRFEFRTSFQRWITIGAAAALSATALLSEFLVSWGNERGAVDGLGVIPTALLSFLAIAILWNVSFTGDEWLAVLLGPVGFLVLAFRHRESDVLVALLPAMWLPAILILTHDLVMPPLTWAQFLVIVAALMTTCSLVLWDGLRKDRAARNPLQPLVRKYLPQIRIQE